MGSSGRYAHLNTGEEGPDRIEKFSIDDGNLGESSDDAFEDDVPSSDSSKAQHVSGTGSSSSVAALGIVSSLGFCATYFWRYPVFMLPSSILGTSVVVLFGTKLDLQSCFSLAYIGGFGSAKIMGMRLIASDFFFRHRLAVICAMAVFTMTVECVGVWIFASQPPLQVLSVFISSFVQSWIYGAVLTYVEGREQTETLLAIMGLFFINAGGAARGAATIVLNMGVPPLLMPLTLGLIACPFCCSMMYLTDCCPKPSAADLASRCERSPISPSEQRKFLFTYACGMGGIYVAYAILTGVRYFRDFYAEQIYFKALQGAPPAWVFLVADLPGGIIASLVIYSFKSYHDHRAALRAMLCTCVGGGVLILSATTMFVTRTFIGGLFWQIILGIGLYVGYGILTSAVYDRIVAATGTESTCTFLVFLGDCFGYIVTFGILLLRDFGSKAQNDGATADEEDAILQVFLLLVYLGIGVAVICLLAASFYFRIRLREEEVVAELEVLELTETAQGIT